MDFNNAFSPDYYSARTRFRELSRALIADVNAYPVSSAGEDLTIDVSMLGDPQSKRTVIVSSGLHGVEGFAGSAIQLALPVFISFDMGLQH